MSLELSPSTFAVDTAVEKPVPSFTHPGSLSYCVSIVRLCCNLHKVRGGSSLV